MKLVDNLLLGPLKILKSNLFKILEPKPYLEENKTN